MPYSSLDDANPAIKGIDPPVTLSQANTIAEWADKIEAEGDVDSPWAVAIAQFKKAYEVKDGKWVKKKQEERMNLARQLWEQIQAVFRPHLEEERAVGLGRLFNQLDLALYESSDHGMAWLHDIYRDDDGSLFAIASERGKLYRVSLEFSEDGAMLGEWVPVTEEFRPVSETRTRIIRQADGRVRWLSISCTSVLNRVGEIDSKALFDSFVEHVQRTNEYPYRTFYHQGEALRTGQCDFMARDKHVYITSGLYDDDNPLAAAEIKAMERNADKWGESIGYMPTAGPEMVEIASDVTIPVYNVGVIREISTLPNDSAAAWFTTIRTQEVRRMRQDVMDALLELLDGDEERVAEFAKLVDSTNREIEAGDLVSREADPGEGGVGEQPIGGGGGEQPADETPDPVGPAPEIEREVVLDQAAVDLITAQFAEMLAPFTEKIEALEKALSGVVDTQMQAVDEARQAREALDTRLKAVERDEDDKQRQWLADMPRKETLNVTHRPREANKPEGDEGAKPGPSAILDQAGVPQYA